MEENPNKFQGEQAERCEPSSIYFSSDEEMVNYYLTLGRITNIKRD